MESRSKETAITSACPLNCWDMCSFSVAVAEGKVVKVNGNREHPITKGQICSRGRQLEKKTNDVSRVIHPLKKINGTFEQISWEQALDEIAVKLRKVKEQFGPTAVLHSHDYANNGLVKNVDERFFRGFGGFTKLEGSLCWGAGLQAQIQDFGNSVAHAPEDIENSKHIVIWGRNASRTNIHLFARLMKAKKRGATVTVIDPIRNDTAKKADLYVSVRPGMDGFLAAGVIKALLELELEDRTFIAHHTYGWDDLLTLVTDISYEEIVKCTGVDKETIYEVARIYGDSPTVTYLGLGMQRYANGGNTIRLIDAIGAASGNVGIPGGGVMYGHLAVSQLFDTDLLAKRCVPAEIRTFTRMNQAEKILTDDDPPVTMAFVTRGNPLTQIPDTNVAKQAFESIDTLVVADHYLSDTAKLADYVLPSTTVFEEEDLYFAAMYHDYVNYSPAIVKAKGEAKSDLWMWTELSKRLGFGDWFDYSREDWLKIGTKTLRGRGWSLEDTKRIGFSKLPIPDVAWADYQFDTPSGKYEFTSQLAQHNNKDNQGRIKLEYPQEAAQEEENVDSTHMYHLLSLHPARSNHSQNYHLLSGENENVIEVSAQIAQDHQLKNGDRGLIYNNRGHLNGKIRVDENLHPEVINVDEGRSESMGGSVNLLTLSGESDMGKGGIQYDCRVSIRKA